MLPAGEAGRRDFKPAVVPKLSPGKKLREKLDACAVLA
jgi:hypothetical protein